MMIRMIRKQTGRMGVMLAIGAGVISVLLGASGVKESLPAYVFVLEGYSGIRKDSLCVFAYYMGSRRLVWDTVKIQLLAEKTDILPKKVRKRLKGAWGCVFSVRKRDGRMPHNGVYILYLPVSGGYVEFLYTAGEPEVLFFLPLDSGGVPRTEELRIEGSEENRLMYAFHRYAYELRADSVEKADSLIRAYAERLIQDHPDAFFSRILQVMYPPEPPGIDTLSPETLWRWMYRHYLDAVPLSDRDLLHTPVIHHRVMFYLDEIVPPLADSLCRKVIQIIHRAEGDSVTFQYWTATLLNKYAQSRIMGMDAVYVCIVDSFYATGKVSWLDSASLQRILFDARLLKYTLIGKPAPPIILKDTGGQFRSLYQVEAPYIVLLFWDPDCGHCKREVPKLYREVWEPFRKYGIQVFAVNVSTDREHWVEFIRKHHLDGWIHVADLEGKDMFRYYYYLRGTPYILLLDKDKKIIAKHIGVEQLKEILARRLEKEQSLDSSSEDSDENP